MKNHVFAICAPLMAAVLLGCPKESDPPVAPPPTWQSFYGQCLVTGVDYQGTRMYAGTEKDGFRYYNGEFWNHYLKSNSGIVSNVVRDVALDQNGQCWIATELGLSVFDGGGFSAPITFESTGGGLPSNDVRCLFKDSTGGMWAGTAAGAARYNGSAWVTKYTQTDGLAADLVISIGQDPVSGAMWFGHSGAGLTRVLSAVFTVFGSADGLTNTTVNGLAFDSGGTGYFATNGGLFYYDGAFAVYNTGNSGLPNNTVRDVDVDGSDVVWTATNGGVGKLDVSSWNSYTTANGLFSNDVRCIAAGAGASVKAGTYFGLCWITGGSSWTGNILANVPLSHNTIRDVKVDSSGRIWLATEYGVTRRSGANTWEAWSADNSALSANNCLAVEVEASGKAWIGTFTGGLNSFDGSGWQVFNTGNSGLPGNLVSSLLLHPTTGDLWITTWSGVSRFDRVSTFTNWNSAVGLGNNIVNGLAVDLSGNVWAATIGGLSRFDGSTWTNYTIANGLPSNWINGVAVRQAELWVVTNAGAAVSTSGGTSWTVHNVASGALPANNVVSIAFGASGDVWIASGLGLATRTGAVWTTRSSVNSGILADNLDCVFVPAGSDEVHIGTIGAGFCLYRPEHLYPR